MNIIGLDALVFGADDLEACAQYLVDYGLDPTGVDARGAGRYEALDGTAIIIGAKADPSLPPPMGTASQLRKTVWGVADAVTLDRIEAELARDREVKRLEDGSIEAVDDMGFTLGFRITMRQPIEIAGERVNAPGDSKGRVVNSVAVSDTLAAKPRSLSHVVYFVPDAVKAEAFYKRIGFRCTDRFTGVGPFMQPAGSLDHHALFMIQTPPFMKGIEHFTFHLGGPTEVMHAGTRFVGKGYESFWGPGRHRFGSNWFWYFNSPLGCHVEYDADMDQHDGQWTERELPSNADTSQLFLFQHRDKWVPGGPPPKGAPAR